MLCPHNCKSNRLLEQTGVCGSNAEFAVSSICAHRGEEPVLSGSEGICNVFFSRCNLSCSYCQNYQISNSKDDRNGGVMSFSDVLDSIISLLKAGCHAVGFVSPSHFIPHVKAIIEAIRVKGYNPVFVYNTNGYEKVEEIRALENYIDVYLPDYKYADDSLALQLSKAKRYRSIALSAIKEMYRQMGSTLIMNDQGLLEKGLIVRHLVLPGYIKNSIDVLHDLADISTSLAISLMAQYWPTPAVADHAMLGRVLLTEEYENVKNEMESLGFYKGWVQELESSNNYRPDFESEKPFK